jgi:hypothetical protein
MKKIHIIKISLEEVNRIIETIAANKASSYDGILDQIFSKNQLQ